MERMGAGMGLVILFLLSLLLALVSAATTWARWKSWSPFDRAVGITPFLLLLLLLIGSFLLGHNPKRPNLGASGQTIPVSAETNYIQLHEENLAKRFEMGSTNVPLLRVHSFNSAVTPARWAGLET